MITIGEDLEYINNYLLIKHIAVRDRIQVNKSIDNSCLNVNIPPFTLPPLVENAFIHGLEPKEERGTLSITVMRETHRIRIVIEDDGLGMSNEMVEQILNLNSKQSKQTNVTSLGINNVIKTLTYYFGEAFQWDLKSSLGQGTKITLLLPDNNEFTVNTR
jgi:sensor histidine kinase YesM